MIDLSQPTCPGCGYFSSVCKCAGAEFRVGDVIRRKGVLAGSRYRVMQSQAGWFAAHRIRKDGGRDRREFGFSGSPLWFEVVEEGDGS